MKVSMILAACPSTGIIGIGGSIPWYIPEDLKRFQRVTKGNTVIMGRKTWDSLPVKPLPGRSNMILSSKYKQFIGVAKDQAYPDTYWVRGLKQAVNSVKHRHRNLMGDVFIIGGARLYDEAFYSGLVEEVHLTEVHNLRLFGNKLTRVSFLSELGRWGHCDHKEVFSDHTYRVWHKD